MSQIQTGTVSTKFRARLDRLPWSRWHWMIIIGLGTVLSTRGGGAVSRLLAAVSQYVLRHAPRPVLVVPDASKDR